jgi:hypothetical protein
LFPPWSKHDIADAPRNGLNADRIAQRWRSHRLVLDNLFQAYAGTSSPQADTRVTILSGPNAGMYEIRIAYVSFPRVPGELRTKAALAGEFTGSKLQQRITPLKLSINRYVSEAGVLRPGQTGKVVYELGGRLGGLSLMIVGLMGSHQWVWVALYAYCIFNLGIRSRL